MTCPRNMERYATWEEVALTTPGLKIEVATKVLEANIQGKEEGTGEGQEEHQGEDPEAVLRRAKATTKDSEIMIWDCLKDGALAATRSIRLKEDMEIAEVVDVHRNQSQRTEVEATGEEVIIIRHLEKVSSMTIRVQMATLSLNSIKGSVIQREEEPANRINEGGRIVKELQLHCNRVTSLTVMQ